MTSLPHHDRCAGRSAARPDGGRLAWHAGCSLLAMLAAGCGSASQHDALGRAVAPTGPREPARCRPGEPCWPTERDWQQLRSRLRGTLDEARSPLEPCRAAARSEACATPSRCGSRCAPGSSNSRTASGSSSPRSSSPRARCGASSSSRSTRRRRSRPSRGPGSPPGSSGGPGTPSRCRRTGMRITRGGSRSSCSRASAPGGSRRRCSRRRAAGRSACTSTRRRPGHRPMPSSAAARIVREATPGAGSYVNETDYFEPNWQSEFWGENYPRLLQIKRTYDPHNMFTCHHCVGSED